MTPYKTRWMKKTETCARLTKCLLDAVLVNLGVCQQDIAVAYTLPRVRRY